MEAEDLKKLIELLDKYVYHHVLSNHMVKKIEDIQEDIHKTIETRDRNLIKQR